MNRSDRSGERSVWSVRGPGARGLGKPRGGAAGDLRRTCAGHLRRPPDASESAAASGLPRHRARSCPYRQAARSALPDRLPDGAGGPERLILSPLPGAARCPTLASAAWPPPASALKWNIFPGMVRNMDEKSTLLSGVNVSFILYLWATFDSLGNLRSVVSGCKWG